MEPLRLMRGYLSWIVLGIIALVTVSFLWSWINSPLVITVSGRGEIDVPATHATITLSITDTNPDPQAAINLVKAKSDTIRKLLIGSAVAEKNIFASEVSVVPSTTLDQTNSGYQAFISMGAKDIPISNLEPLVPKLYRSGASLVTQPVISVQNQEELEAKALDEALKDAKKQANTLAWKNWKFIKKATAMVESATEPTSITQKTDQEAATGSTYKIIKTITVSYRMW